MASQTKLLRWPLLDAGNFQSISCEEAAPTDVAYQTWTKLTRIHESIAYEASKYLLYVTKSPKQPL